MPIRCGVWHDIVFVNLTGDATPLEDYVAPLSKLWAGYDLDSPRPFEHAESTMDANWKVVKEGLLDVYHEEFVHPALSYRIDRDGTKTWEDIMVGDIMGMRSVVPADVDDHPDLSLPRLPGMPLDGPTPTYIFLLFPSVSINVLDNHVVRTIWSAHSPAETRWRSTWYFTGEAVESERHQAECQEIVDFWKAVRGEDQGVVTLVQRGHQSLGPGPREVRFSPFWDDLLLHFQRHLVKALS